jgi:hypothetical protein
MQSSGSEGGQSRLYDTTIGNADIQTQGFIILYINPSVNTRDKLQLKIITDVRQDQQRAHTSSFAAEELLPALQETIYSVTQSFCHGLNKIHRKSASATI